MNQVRIKGTGHLRVNIKRRGRASTTLERYVKTNGTIAGKDLAEELGVAHGQLVKIMQGIVRIVRAGYEVRLGKDRENCVRFYPVLDKSYDHMLLVAQTCGDLRSAVSDLGFTPYHKGEEVGLEDIGELQEAQTEKHDKLYASVTPDIMVTCDVCGNRIRVGKSLAH